MSLLKGIQQKLADQIITEVKNLTALDKSGKFSPKQHDEIISILTELKKRDIFKPIEKAISYDECILKHGVVSNWLKFKQKSRNLVLKIQEKEKFNIFKKKKKQYIKTVLIKNNAIYVGDLHGDFSVLETKKGELEYFLKQGWSVVFLGDLMDMRNPEQKDRSIAVLLCALLLSIRYKDQVVILRGNHETRKIFARYGKEYNNNWLYQFGNQNGQKKIMNLLDEIFAKFPITAVHIASKGFYLVSHAGPKYFSKNEYLLFTMILCGGFIDPYGKITDPNKINDAADKVEWNNCLWNSVLNGGIHDEGDYNQKRGYGCFVGPKTQGKYKDRNIIGCICGHMHVNKSFFDFYHSISTGNFSGRKNEKYQPIVGVVKDGIFSHCYFNRQSILSLIQCQELKH